MVAIVVMTAVIAAGIGFGSMIAGGDVITPILGSLVLGLYAAALAGIVIATFLLDILAPALKWPEWVHDLALSAHLGQPMIGTWDWPGMIACVVIALGGVVLAGVGIARRDVER